MKLFRQQKREPHSSASASQPGLGGKGYGLLATAVQDDNQRPAARSRGRACTSIRSAPGLEPNAATSDTPASAARSRSAPGSCRPAVLPPGPAVDGRTAYQANLWADGDEGGAINFAAWA